MSSTHGSHDSGHGHGAHETQDFTFKNVLWLIPVSIILLVIYVGVCMYGYKGAATAEMISKSLALKDTSLFAYRAHEKALLEGYSWVDKEAGTVRIPIAEAMKSVVQSYNQAPAEAKSPASK